VQLILFGWYNLACEDKDCRAGELMLDEVEDRSESLELDVLAKYIPKLMTFRTLAVFRVL